MNGGDDGGGGREGGGNETASDRLPLGSWIWIGFREMLARLSLRDWLGIGSK